jgi:4-diphosphocytidyl-2-C-methyl-D-erythritol kinase
MTLRQQFAPAKINLYLHVTGRREDGYHVLESLVAFADIGDILTLAPAKEFQFSTEGSFGGAFTEKERDASRHSSNLVVRAVWALSDALQRAPLVHVALAKNLPLAAGLGGGSADAAAIIRALLAWWEVPPHTVPNLAGLLTALGADVPACFALQPQWVGGVGEILRPAGGLPEIPVVLVNPKRECSTAAVFAGFGRKFAPHSNDQPVFAGFRDLIQFLERHDNMLTPAAMRLVPEIGVALSRLALQPGCRFARMSGSGATSFGLFDDRPAAARAAENLLAEFPQWWVQAGTLNRFDGQN